MKPKKLSIKRKREINKIIASESKNRKNKRQFPKEQATTKNSKKKKMSENANKCNTYIHTYAKNY